MRTSQHSFRPLDINSDDHQPGIQDPTALGDPEHYDEEDDLEGRRGSGDRPPLDHRRRYDPTRERE